MRIIDCSKMWGARMPKRNDRKSESVRQNRSVTTTHEEVKARENTRRMNFKVNMLSSFIHCTVVITQTGFSLRSTGRNILTCNMTCIHTACEESGRQICSWLGERQELASRCSSPRSRLERLASARWGRTWPRRVRTRVATLRRWAPPTRRSAARCPRETASLRSTHRNDNMYDTSRRVTHKLLLLRLSCHTHIRSVSKF